jgi:hypothetical protein
MKRKCSKPLGISAQVLILLLVPFLAGCGGGGGGAGEGEGGTALVHLSTTTLTFSSQGVGTTSAPQSLAISSTGTADLNITSISTSAPFAQNNNCPSQLPPGMDCTINVTYTPKTGGTQTGTLTVADNAGGDPQTVTLSGTGAVAPAVSLSATSLTAGSFPVGTTSGTTNLVVTNSGTAALSISSVTLTGPNPGDFALNNGCPGSLAAGGNCSITFTFTPTAPGTRTAYINITDNAAGSPQTVTISGTGQAPAASLSTSSLTFASQTTGTTSAPQTITLTNSGNESLSISSIGLTGANPGDFTQSNTCGSSVAPGNTCMISVSFTPPATGTFSATLALTDNASGSPQSVSLSGTGVTPATASLSATSLAFGNQGTDTTSSSQTVTLSNTGGAALIITSMAFTGANAGDFTQNNNCGTSVAGGTSCTISIVFTPSASGSAAASFQMTDSAIGSPQVITLSGTGTHDVILTWAAVTTQSVAGYNIFRGTSPSGESSTPLNSTPVQGTSYTDESVSAGTTYYYVITAVSQYGATQSAASNEVSATVPSP